MQSYKKRVLIILYYWPPEGGVGVRRWLKFTYHLIELGWDITIFTANKKYFINYDTSLLKEIHPKLKIIKKNIFEPHSFYSLISKKEIEKLLNEGLNFTEIGSLYGRNLHYIRTLCKKYNLKIKSKVCICLNCQKKFKHKATIPAKYCSTKCRSAHWPKINKEKHKELVKKSRFKCHPVKCRKCKNNIPDDNRKSGLVYCSDLCRKQNKIISNKQSRDKKYKQFGLYKISIGCKIVDIINVLVL